MTHLANKSRIVLTPKLGNYVHAYIFAWLKEDSWPKDEDNKAKLKEIHDAWPFYVSRGFFETEEFYVSFLENNGFEQFPAFLQLMDNLQEHRKSIFLTDGNPRQVPFPPAFQAAFFRLMKSAIMSGADDGLRHWIASLEMMMELGMSRLHQSARQGDYHIMPIEQWLHFLKSIQGEEKASWNNAIIEAEGMELIKTWLDIYRDWQGHITKSSWTFSPETEEERLSEPTVNDWYYTFRDGFSKESWIRCLEITGAEHLCSVLCLGYIYSPKKFHHSLGHGDPDDVFLQTSFEEAIESFLFSPKRDVHDAKEQARFIGKALKFLEALGIREFYDGFDVVVWANALTANESDSETTLDVKTVDQWMAGTESQPTSIMTTLRMFFKEGWAALKDDVSNTLCLLRDDSYSLPLRRERLEYIRYRLANTSDAHRESVDEGNYNHAPAPSGPVQFPGLSFFIFVLVVLGGAVCASLQPNQTASNNHALIIVVFAMLLCGPLLWKMWEAVLKYVRFCIFARWKRQYWGRKHIAERTEEQKIINEWGTWYHAMTGDSFDCDTTEISQAIRQAENLAYAWDWANPALVYYGDRKMFDDIYMGLSRARNQILSEWQGKVSVRLFPRTPPNPIEEEISLEELIAKSHGKCTTKTGKEAR